MEKDGEASCFPDLRQDGLCIVSVGRASQKNGECAADELLQQLMTLPRPVCVGFARTASASIVQAVPVESPQKVSIRKRDAAPRCARFSLHSDHLPNVQLKLCRDVREYSAVLIALQ